MFSLVTKRFNDCAVRTLSASMRLYGQTDRYFRRINANATLSSASVFQSNVSLPG
jgi:hypothetical protein